MLEYWKYMRIQELVNKGESRSIVETQEMVYLMTSKFAEVSVGLVDGRNAEEVD